MIKLLASVAKKVPMPDLEFSSQQYSAGMEVEVASGASGEEIQKKLKALYALLEESIDEQIQACQAKSGAEEDTASHGNGRAKGSKQSGSGGNGSRSATKAQVKAIYAIAREQGCTDQDIERIVSKSFGTKAPEELSIGQASELIDTLKNDGKE